MTDETMPEEVVVEPTEEEVIDPPVEETEPVDEEDDKPVSRAQARVQALIRERAEAQAKAQAASEQAEFYRRQAEMRQPQEELDPDEAWRRQVNTQLQQMHMQTLDANDRVTFTTKFASSPDFAKYADKVEAELQKARGNGVNATREGIFYYMMGKDRVENIRSQSAKKREGEKRVASAKGTPTSPRSDIAAGKTTSTAEERLRDILI